MPARPSRRSALAAATLAVFAALVIGCGGGGGGGSNGSSGGTTNTTGNTDTGGNTIGGGTDGGGGTLQANTIYYVTVGAGGYDVRYTREDGTGAGTYASGLSDLSPAASPDPTSAGRLVFAAPASSGSGTFGIYRNTGASTSGALTIVSPRYSEVDTLQVSRDGTKVLYVAATSEGSDPHLYLANVSANATPQVLDNGYVVAADLSSDGSTVVYERFPDSGATQLYKIDLNAASPTPVALTSDALDKEEPQFSKNGENVAFSRQDGAGRYVLGYLTAGSSAITTVDPFPGTAISARAPSFNSDGTRLAFIAESDDASQAGIYTCDLAGGTVTRVVPTDIPPRRALYWTNVNGRGAGLSLHLSSARNRAGR